MRQRKSSEFSGQNYIFPALVHGQIEGSGGLEVHCALVRVILLLPILVHKCTGKEGLGGGYSTWGFLYGIV